jgi:geranyl-CoA carboxylase alpha subunit
VTYAPPEPADGPSENAVRAPMNGKVVAVLAKTGETVAKGQRLVVLEAMKMQHELLAPRAGTLAEIVGDGAQVANRQVLARLA